MGLGGLLLDGKIAGLSAGAAELEGILAEDSGVPTGPSATDGALTGVNVGGELAGVNDGGELAGVNAGGVAIGGGVAGD